MQEMIGLMAGTLTTIAFVPQVWKVWRSRSTQDISLVMYLVFSLGVVLWLIYGILIQAWPIILANSVTLMLALSILAMKVCFDKEKR